ncbi:MAG: hypothetical protein MK033_05100 [Candidatus Caenarcaniphilales bacterium]|nr:hypothetical protein [Candidatus Caenarcaniphilales bacterium]
MSKIKVFSENTELLEESNNQERIKIILADIGIKFEQWQLPSNVQELNEEEIYELYSDQIKLIKETYKFKAVDLMNINNSFAQNSNFKATREKFLKEHTHSDDEVRYFISGSGLFTIHKAKKVHSILCEAGDLINVPANTQHWFDMGSKPEFKCLRFFSDESGWIPDYSDESISHKFENLDEYIELC